MYSLCIARFIRGLYRWLVLRRSTSAFGAMRVATDRLEAGNSRRNVWQELQKQLRKLEMRRSELRSKEI